jgi:hypothetical protein
MEKIETIVRHKQGNPNEEKSYITWIEFVAIMKPVTEKHMNNMAISLLNGNFLYGDDGYVYFLNGIKER